MALKIFLWILACELFISVNASSPYYPAKQSYKKAKRPYAFAYGVEDKYAGTNFGQTEYSDGKNVKGSYTVQLPDGRKQLVKYTADHYNGFQADVSYYGKAKYPSKSPYPPFVVKPSHSGYKGVQGHGTLNLHSPIYKPTPQYKPTYTKVSYPIKPLHSTQIHAPPHSSFKKPHIVNPKFQNSNPISFSSQEIGFKSPGIAGGLGGPNTFKQGLSHKKPFVPSQPDFSLSGPGSLQHDPSLSGGFKPQGSFEQGLGPQLGGVSGSFEQGLGQGGPLNTFASGPGSFSSFEQGGINSQAGFGQQGFGSFEQGLGQQGFGSFGQGLGQQGFGSFEQGLGQQGFGSFEQGLEQQGFGSFEQGLGQQGFGSFEQGLGQQGFGSFEQGLGQQGLGSFGQGFGQQGFGSFERGVGNFGVGGNSFEQGLGIGGFGGQGPGFSQAGLGLSGSGQFAKGFQSDEKLDSQEFQPPSFIDPAFIPDDIKPSLPAFKSAGIQKEGSIEVKS